MRALDRAGYAWTGREVRHGRVYNMLSGRILTKFLSMYLFGIVS